MKIDIIEAKKQFEKYVQNYDDKDPQILLKIKHIERVSNNSKIIAQNLNLSNEDIELAELIGLLHDIGRFEQVKIYHTFKDRDSINHAEFGCKILFEKGLIRKFIQTDEYDEIIKKAILNHNKTNIDKDLTDRELLHSKIIRDADKLDIFKLLIADDPNILWESNNMNNEKINDETYREFIEDKKMNYKNNKSAVDLLVCHFAYIYDLNFNITYNIVYGENFIDRLYNRFDFKDEETKKRMKEIHELANKYLKSKITK